MKQGEIISSPSKLGDNSWGLVAVYQVNQARGDRWQVFVFTSNGSRYEVAPKIKNNDQGQPVLPLWKSPNKGIIIRDLGAVRTFLEDLPQSPNMREKTSQKDSL